jgi:dephospho-CoA kinase
MAVIAVTGGIAAGKTLVCSTLQSLGALVIDADLLAREAVAPGSKALNQLVDYFGAEILAKDGSLNRGALGALVFGNPEKLAALNAIVHPEVRNLYDESLARLQREHPDSVVVYDVPLLAEARSAKEFDAVVVVHTPAEQRVARLQEFRGMTAKDATARVSSQASDEDRLALATVVIDSSGTMAETVRQTTELYQALMDLWPNRLGDLPKQFPR